MGERNISKFRLQKSKVLDTHKELAIELTEDAEAFEYRQGILMETKTNG